MSGGGDTRPRTAGAKRGTAAGARRTGGSKRGSKYTLRLYVAGLAPASARAIAAMREVCETHLGGRYQLEIIDIYKSPDVAREDQILAIPTLVKQLPPPLRKLVGDFSNVERVLVGLDIMPHGQPAAR